MTLADYAELCDLIRDETNVKEVSFVISDNSKLTFDGMTWSLRVDDLTITDPEKVHPVAELVLPAVFTT